MIPGQVMVINRAVDTGRLADFDRRWAAAAPGVGYQRIDAVDRPGDPTSGLYESHLRALDDAAGEPVLILEDDAVFTDAFTLDLPQPPAGWFLLRLGGALRATGGTPGVGPGPARLPAGLGTPSGPWVPVGIAHQTHAYVAAQPQLLAAVVRARPFTDIGGALMLALPGHWRLNPGTVGQAAGASTITPDRDRGGDQFW